MANVGSIPTSPVMGESLTALVANEFGKWKMVNGKWKMIQTVVRSSIHHNKPSTLEGVNAGRTTSLLKPVSLVGCDNPSGGRHRARSLSTLVTPYYLCPV